MTSKTKGTAEDAVVTFMDPGTYEPIYLNMEDLIDRKVDYFYRDQRLQELTLEQLAQLSEDIGNYIQGAAARITALFSENAPKHRRGLKGIRVVDVNVDTKTPIERMNGIKLVNPEDEAFVVIHFNGFEDAPRTPLIVGESVLNDNKAIIAKTKEFYVKLDEEENLVKNKMIKMQEEEELEIYKRLHAKYGNQ